MNTNARAETMLKVQDSKKRLGCLQEAIVSLANQVLRMEKERDQIQTLLPVMEHFASGGQIEHRDGGGEWYLWRDEASPSFKDSADNYRIIKRKNRALRMSDLQAVQWFKDPKTGGVYLATEISTKGICIGGVGHDFEYLRLEGFNYATSPHGPWFMCEIFEE